jgi:hypothetical protein
MHLGHTCTWQLLLACSSPTIVSFTVSKDNDDKKTDGEAGAAATPVDDAYFTLYSASGRRDLYVNVYRTPTNDKLWKHDAFLSLFGCPSYVRFTFHFWVECKLNRYKRQDFNQSRTDAALPYRFYCLLRGCAETIAEIFKI